MRWDCLRRGCFNVLKRPKIEVFHDCFGNGINFGDVDGIVERCGHFLLLEWKPGPGAVGVGQRILHDALLKIPQFSLVVVHGDPDSMKVQSFVIRREKFREDVQGDIEALKAKVKAWFAYADKQPRAA